MKITPLCVYPVFVLLLFGLNVSAQLGPNLVKNPSFESYNDCPTELAQMYASHWIPSLNTSDLHPNPATCTDFYSNVNAGWIVGGPCAGESKPNKGVAHIGICTAENNWKEYVSTSPTSGILLNKGEEYKVGFHVRGCQGSVATEIQLNINSSPITSQNVGGLVSNVNLTYTLTSNGYFIAEGVFKAQTTGEHYLTIGNIDNPISDQLKYVFIDDVFVHNKICVDKKYIQDHTYDNEVMIYQASQEIWVGNNVDPDPTASTGDVYYTNNSYIVYRAPMVKVMQGTTFKMGGDYHVLSEMPCTEDPCPDNPMISDEKYVCVYGGNYSTYLGVDPQPELLYSWEPSQGLDDPFSSNPLFTSTDERGDVVFTCTIKSVCGDEWQVTKRRSWDSYGGPAKINNLNTIEDMSSNSAVLTFDVGKYANQIDVEIVEEGKHQTFDNTDVVNGIFTYNFYPSSTCDNRTVKFEVRNFCGGGVATYEYLWENDCKCVELGFLPNIVVIGGEPMNSKMYAQVTNAEYYSFDFWKNYGMNQNPTHSEGVANPIIYQGEEYVQIWAPGAFRAGDVYAYRGKFYGCNDQEIGLIDGFVHIYEANNKTSSSTEFTSSENSHIQIAIMLSDNTISYSIDGNGGDGRVFIYDLTGQLVFQSEGTSESVSNLASGIYNVIYVEAGVKKTKKVIVQ